MSSHNADRVRLRDECRRLDRSHLSVCSSCTTDWKSSANGVRNIPERSSILDALEPAAHIAIISVCTLSKLLSFLSEAQLHTFYAIMKQIFKGDVQRKGCELAARIAAFSVCAL